MTFVRILLFLLPIIMITGVIMLFRTRKKSGDPFTESDIKRMRWSLIGAIVILIGAFILLRMTDNSADGRDMNYIPPHMEDGELVPGSFKDKEEGDAAESDKSDG